MNLRFLLVFTCVLGTYGGGYTVCRQEAPKDREVLSLQGAWALTRFEGDGKIETYELPQTYRVLVTANTWLARWVGEPGSAGVSRTRFKIDPDKAPKEIDFPSTDAKKEAMPGIYSLAGDTLTICFARTGTTRPSEFHVKPGDGRYLLTFKRDVGGPDEPTPTTLLPFLKDRFSLSFPASARIANFSTQADPITRPRPVREVFAEITLPPEAYPAFRKWLLDDEKRPAGQRIQWEGKERPPMIGGLPGPYQVPRAAKWWEREGADTLCVLLHEQYHPDPLHGGAAAFTETTSAVVIFLSEKKSRVMLWAFVSEGYAKERGAKKPEGKKEADAKKPEGRPAGKAAELRGVLRVSGPPKLAPDLRSGREFAVADPKAPLTGVAVAVEQFGVVDVDLADDQKALAKELNGREVVIRGELRRLTVIPLSYRAAISGVEVHDEQGRLLWIPLGGEMPEVRSVIRARSLKAVGPKPKPMAGEPSINNPFGGKPKLSTFQRLPKAADITALRITAAGNRTEQRLTAPKFLAVVESMRPVRADDPKYRTWHYASWYTAEFETSEGRYLSTLYLGGLALVSTPDGSLGLVTFKLPQ